MCVCACKGERCIYDVCVCVHVKARDVYTMCVCVCMYRREMYIRCVCVCACTGERCIYEEDLFEDQVISILKAYADNPRNNPDNPDNPLFLVWTPHLVHMPLQVQGY